MDSLPSKIESLLFAAARPVKISELVRALGVGKPEVKTGLEGLRAELSGRVIVIVEKDERYQLMTHPDSSKLVGDFVNAELREKLTDAALETLAIVLYKQPVTRAEIEAIRGVNSQYILRQLAMRGMVEKATHPQDARRLVYSTTLDFMAYLGVREMKDLPDFEELTKSVSLPDAAPASPEAQSSSLPSLDKDEKIGDN